jgi:hypothetical protein
MFSRSARPSAGPPAGSYVQGALKSAIDTYAAAVTGREGQYNERLKAEIQSINTSVDKLIARIAELKQQLTAKETEITRLKLRPDNVDELRQANVERASLKQELASGITQLNDLTQSLGAAQPMPQELTALKDKITTAIGPGSGDGGGGYIGPGGLFGGSKKYKKSKKRRKYKKRKSKRK